MTIRNRGEPDANNHPGVPVPFSVFPSSYKNQEASAQTTEVKSEERITVQDAGREGRYQPSQAIPSRRDDRYTREDVRITEEDRYRQGPSRRVEVKEEVRTHEDDRYRERRDTRFEVGRDHQSYREPYSRYTNAQIDVEDKTYDREYNTRHTPATQVDYNSRLDNVETEYRQRTAPFTQEYRAERTWQDKSTTPRDYPAAGYPERENVTFDEKVKVTEERTVDPPRTSDRKHRVDMGYYDEDGHYHSFRHGLHRAADRILYGPQDHHESHHRTDRREDSREEVIEVDREEVNMSGPRYSEERSSSSRGYGGGIPNTITIPCHHIRIGDLLILQGRPCQVIRITTSAQTGQHRYLGVDLFTKQLHEESSFVSNPSPSVIVQNMLGPVFKQYRVLDIRDDGRVVAMTETGDVKQGLRVLDQSSLLGRLTESFNNGRGSVRVLVISDEGRELAVDYKVVHGSRL
ncbi:hypothetical protein LTR62_006486 [Meristemomyces frigidus]|uniref:Woronin body major protein n=1 Tax=Meristemomyces frigidus TaxID=1508187 RepID=A0AAN7TDF8_9PEZI|nr:hypothetical protein LTR62_006486 [Meristemomyces frigidus]